MSKASDRAYKAIRDMILSGRLAPGSRLKEEELAESIGVSRTPVRDALRRLEGDFFVRRADNQRSFVREWSLEDIEDIFALRALLEGDAAARAARRSGPNLLVALRSHHQVVARALEQPGGIDIDGYLHHNRAFHRLILEAAASDRLSDIITRLIAQPILVRTAMSYQPDDLRKSHAEHAELIEAIAVKDAEWARAIMSGHIRRAFHVFKAAYLEKLGISGGASNAA